MRITYAFHKHAHGVSAQTVGEAFETIRQKNKGVLKPDDVVDSARDGTSPIHPLFTWDDQVAAEKYRCFEARRVINDLRIIKAPQDGARRTIKEIRYVSTFQPFERDSGGYRPVAEVRKNPTVRRAITKRAVRTIQTGLSQLRLFQETRETAERIESILSEIKPTTRKQHA